MLGLRCKDIENLLSLVGTTSSVIQWDFHYGPRSRDSLRLTAPERKRQPSLQSPEPPPPTEAATFAAPENAKVRNGASLDRCFRHVSSRFLLVARNPIRSAVR